MPVLPRKPRLSEDRGQHTLVMKKLRSRNVVGWRAAGLGRGPASSWPKQEYPSAPGSGRLQVSLFPKKKIIILFFYVFGCFTGITHILGAGRCQKRLLGSLELELQVAVNHYVDAGNGTRVLWKCSECSSLLRHLSSTSFFIPCERISWFIQEIESQGLGGA